jgi:hypothetical protein
MRALGEANTSRAGIEGNLVAQSRQLALLA